MLEGATLKLFPIYEWSYSTTIFTRMMATSHESIMIKSFDSSESSGAFCIHWEYEFSYLHTFLLKKMKKALLPSMKMVELFKFSGEFNTLFYIRETTIYKRGLAMYK